MQCFISYSHKNHDQFERIQTGMKALANLYEFDLWADTRINAGDYWTTKIQDEIAKSDVFVCAASNDFFASDYIFTRELPAILQRHKKNNALVLPVMLCESTTLTYFGNYIEVVPKDKSNNLKPISQWRNKEDAYGAAINAIGLAIADRFNLNPTATFGGHPNENGGGQ